jgi:Big-like domain-containing protein
MGHPSFPVRMQVIIIVLILQTAFHSSYVSAQTTLPTVSITAPKSNAFLNGMVTVTVQAYSPNGIASVDVIYTQGIISQDIPPGPKLQSPYTWNWNTSSVDNGTYTLQAQAFDNNGNNATSTPITVTIANGPPGAPALTPGSLGLLVVVVALAAIGVMVLYRKRSRGSLNLPKTSAT